MAVAVVSPRSALAAGTATYSATQTIPVPPASTYAGSGGGDGWAVALSSGAVYNVFHHSSSLTVACHLQSDASACWSPETITDGNGHQFATSGHPGLWLDQSTGKLYVYATRNDSTAGVVCIDTTQATTNTDPFCGFTALTAVGDAPDTGISGLSEPALVGTNWYAFNYASGVPASGDQNALLCFDVSTQAACASQPFAVSFGSGNISAGTFPEPQLAAIGGLVVVTATVSTGDQLGCFDPGTGHTCSGAWPVTLAASYASGYGAPFPLLSSSGSVQGLCLPTGSDPCYDLSGASVATPSGMTGAIPATSGWNGRAFVLGPRVYVPNGNSDAVDCYDASTNASCTNFPKTMSNLGLLYTVNADPQRPTCIWVNSDDGSGQIQNFDAYTGGACGQGPIRVLASSFVVPTQLCQPATYTSLQVTAPAPGTYTSGTVSFEDGDANPLSGVPDKTLDGTGTVGLSSLNLSTSVGLPQFLITLNGAQGSPGAVTVKLTWTGTDDPSCVLPGTTVSQGPPTSIHGCPPLKFFGVRGTGEHSGYGPTIWSLEQDMKAKVPGMKAIAIDYPAIDIPLPTASEIAEASPAFLGDETGLALAAAQYGYTLTRYHSGYYNSLTAGLGELLAQYNAYERKCPGTPVMFAGYSQGADVTTAAYEILRSSAKRHVILVNFGDPHFDEVENWVEHGGYSDKLQAILVHWWGDPAHSFTSSDRSHVGSWCAAGDLVCNWSWANVLSGGIGIHEHDYVSQYTGAAASWAYNAWKNLP
jgi:Cutinase